MDGEVVDLLEFGRIVDSGLGEPQGKGAATDSPATRNATFDMTALPD
jgi:hypothetical protein